LPLSSLPAAGSLRPARKSDKTARKIAAIRTIRLAGKPDVANNCMGVVQAMHVRNGWKDNLFVPVTTSRHSSTTGIKEARP